MTIFLKKFGTILTGRQFGRESSSAFKPCLAELKKNEKVKVDFKEITAFTPSWGDEFLRPLLNKFGKRLILKNTGNPSVQITLSLLEKIYNKKFNIKNPNQT